MTVSYLHQQAADEGEPVRRLAAAAEGEPVRRQAAASEAEPVRRQAAAAVEGEPVRRQALEWARLGLEIPPVGTLEIKLTMQTSPTCVWTKIIIHQCCDIGDLQKYR